MTENEEEVINLLLAQVSRHESLRLFLNIPTLNKLNLCQTEPELFLLCNQENEILTEQEELISLEQVLRRQIATEKEEIERLRAEIADIQR